MKNLPLSFVTFMGCLIIIYSSPINAQDVTKKEKTISVKIVKEENGKKVSVDTTIFVKGENNDIDLKKLGIDTDHNNKQHIVITSDDVHKEGDSEYDENRTVIIHPDGSHYAFIEAPNAIQKTFQVNNEYDHEVSDIELRDAGVKNKQDRLNAENINIDIDNGVVDFSFTIDTEENLKVTVYNVYGDKVFNDKPVVANGSYKIRIDLSTKQHGTYYIQVVSAHSSFTKKIKL